MSGTVCYQGEPLTDATVGFVPKEFKNGNRIATGMTDVNGRFSLRTIGESGVLPDEYGVMIIKNIEEGEAKKQPMGHQQQRQIKKIKSAIPVRYNAVKTSGLSFSIGQDGLDTLIIELTD